MAIAKGLTDNSWILEAESGDKIGLISYNPETSKYLLIASDMEVAFDTMDELGHMIASTVTVRERKKLDTSFNELEGYAIFHETAIKVETNDNGWISYQPSERSRKRFYAGYWVTPNAERSAYIMRITLVDSSYKKMLDEGFEVHGPYKDKIQATFLAKQLTTSMKSTDK